MSKLLDRAKSVKGNVKTSNGRRRLKNLDKAGDRPSDELTQRFVQWATITKALDEYYNNVKQGEEAAAKEASKRADLIPVPFAEGAQFDQETGFQKILYSVRDHTRTIGSIHTDLASKIETAALLPLNTLAKEIGDHTTAIDADLGKTTNLLADARKESIKAIGEHSKGVGLSASINGHSAASSHSDPFITQGIAHRKLVSQIELENKCTTSTIHWQRTSQAFETRVVTTIQDVTKAFTAAHAASADRLKAEWAAIETLMVGIEPSAEWAYFANPEIGRIVDPNVTLRDPALIAFPNQHDESVKPIKTGHIERKKRYTKQYTELFFVLTPSGFLHAYPHEGPDGAEPEKLIPRLSLYLPEFVLGPPSQATDKKNKFHLSSQSKNATGKDSSRGFLGLQKKKEVAYTFKARSHGELMDWWNAIDKVVKSSMTITSNAGTQSASKAETAVANIGLPTEEHEEDADVSTVDDTAAAAPTATTTAAPEAIPGQPQTTTVAHEDSDNESVGGSSVEEEAAAAKDVTTSNAAESAEATPSEKLPSYVAGQLQSHEYPIEKKVAFDAEPNAGEPSHAAPTTAHPAQ